MQHRIIIGRNLRDGIQVLVRADRVQPAHRRDLHAVLLLVQPADQLAGVLGQRVAVLVVAVEMGLGDVVDALHVGEPAGVHDVVRADDVRLAGQAGDRDQLRRPEDAGQVVHLVAALERAQQRVHVADVGVDVAGALGQADARVGDVDDDDLGVRLGSVQVQHQVRADEPEPHP